MPDMDPVGPWSAYAPYNRLAGVQTGSSNSELHHLSSGSAAGAPPTTTTQLLPGGFLSPPPVGYETVFSPLFHHASAKPSHYVTQHRHALAQAQAAASKQSSEGEYHQTQAFFDQGANAWQQSSPFGILPHESVVPTTTSKATVYENFNAHFAAAQSLNHLNSQLVAAKNSAARAQSPQVTTAATKPVTTQANSGTFFQAPTTFAGTDSNSNSSKPFPPSGSANLQQSCIVTSPSNPVTSKEYRIPQAPVRTAFLSSPNAPRNNMEKPYAASTKQTPPPQIQTKAQTKIYPELPNPSERQRNAEDAQSQSSPVSFTMEVPGRMNYTGSNSSAKRNQFQHTNYRHYPQATNSENEFQRPKSGAEYNNTNGPDCNVVIPRRPSPLQAHSQASPLGHAPSPVYPMYNSPMNSISSPQHNSSNQITPPSPLDASVPRPNSQTGNVAYPSVITRALNADKSYPERFERQAPQQNTQPSCWDDRPQARKFASQTNHNSNYNNSNIEISSRQIELPGRTEQSQQRVTAVGINDRQQTYFDSGHQVTLQDLSSCRGDPMSIVKNLQQQQSCQIQVEVKQEVKVPSKRRKSSEKPVANEVTPPVEYFAGRIPPPAHSSATNQPQQNGAYFDFDRWNLPPPPTKIFGSQAIHQQHQGIMVPHPHSHHPPPPLPYFPPFHLPPHPPEFPSTVELTPISTYSEQSPQPTTATLFPPVEEQPKVVVPNIEEELNFLSEANTTRKVGTNANILRPNSVNKNANKVSGPGAGFMNSYLKFLQGERDSSPPPATRGGRKQTWTNIKTKTEITPPESNGVHSTPTILPPPPPARLTTQGDPQDDPRYFPLPKERKNNSFDSSDDGFSSEDDIFSKKLPPVVKDPPAKEKTGRKGRPCKPGGPTERKRARQAALLKQQQDQQEKPKEIKDKEPLQRRETSKRAAKEKISIQQLISKTGAEDEEEPSEFVDSDSDPAWTPVAKEEPDEELPNKRGRRGRASTRGRGRGTRNLITAAAQGAGIQEVDGYSSDPSLIKKPKTASNKHTKLSSEDVVPQNVNSVNNDESPFKPGEFVVIKSELNQEWPAIWRVDGRTLLQKYEPFEQNGQTLYRNISTYTSWTPESKKQYVTVPVRYKSENPLETIVEFVKSDMNVLDQEFLDKFMKESEIYQDNFEVYIQTLISQALDSNFLTEIFQEQDEYFLSNVKIIDDITVNKKQKLINILRWPQTVQAAVSTWPCLNVLRELSADTQVNGCVACSQSAVAVRVLMYGQPYNSTTLDGCQPDPQTVDQKDFFMCRLCANRVELFNKITHQKYLMYIECAKRVAEKRQQDLNKDTTFILNELLADERWLSQLFAEVRTSWAEADSLERKCLTKMPTVQ